MIIKKFVSAQLYFLYRQRISQSESISKKIYVTVLFSF